MKRRPSVTLRVTTDQPRTVVFEPMGSEYALNPEDAVLVHVFGRSKRREDADVEVTHEQDAILLWLPTTSVRAWNKAGTELRV